MQNLENKKCPSYDYGICVTAPFPYDVQCKDLKCIWQNKVFFKLNKNNIKDKEA